MTSPTMSYADFFARLSRDGHRPYAYQQRVAEALWARQNVAVRAPTGCGKTKAVLAPFLFAREKIGAARLIYALPLRTLAQGVYQEAQDLRDRCGQACLKVTMQTGEQPDDPFFSLGDIIITTYDQLLSGMLCGPYGLADRLHNINAAAVAGALVVFDEFHLMEPQRAFLTAIACLHLFKDLTRSAWMTATATTPLMHQLRDALGVQEISPADEELTQISALSKVNRIVVKEGAPLNAKAILAHSNGRTIAVANQVARAQKLYQETIEEIKATGVNTPVILLHSRFFTPDRQEKLQAIKEHFGEGRRSPAILIATQVIEAGLNLTCDHLHTEICPMNALVQRAGRCARFPGENGAVHVHPHNGNARPYETPDLERAWAHLPDKPASLTPAKAAEWVESCHAHPDKDNVAEGWQTRKNTCLDRILRHVERQHHGGVSDLIRSGSDDVRVVIRNTPPDRSPAHYEGVSISRNMIQNMIRTLAAGIPNIGWHFTPEAVWEPIRSAHQVDQTYAICLKPEVVRYTNHVGVEIGCAGSMESPDRLPPPRPGHLWLRKETWFNHTESVIQHARARVAHEAQSGSLLAASYGYDCLDSLARSAALLHDIGKLQHQWQQWAENAQKSLDARYRHTALLAHTDFDGADPEAQKMAAQIRPSRPPHAMASAFYGAQMLQPAFQSLHAVETVACLTAVLSHHGGWLHSTLLPLHPKAIATVRELEPETHSLASTMPSNRAMREFAERIRDTIVVDFERWWPLASYLTRTLRLSDRLATEEANNDA